MRPKFIELIEERFKFKYKQLKDMQTDEPHFTNKVRRQLNKMKESIQNRIFD